MRGAKRRRARNEMLERWREFIENETRAASHLQVEEALRLLVDLHPVSVGAVGLGIEVVEERRDLLEVLQVDVEEILEAGALDLRGVK